VFGRRGSISEILTLGGLYRQGIFPSIRRDGCRGPRQGGSATVRRQELAKASAVNSSAIRSLSIDLSSGGEKKSFR